MSQFKRWPIGLQSGPNGDPQGIGEVIQKLSEHQIAMFSAATDSMSILFELQQARIETGVPHTGNYRPTGRVNGYNLDVPEYGVVPSPEGAKRHWDHVNVRELPPEIEWDVPCIWLSTWNEVRPYLGWSQMGSNAPAETPVDGFEGSADWLGQWACEIGKEAVARGYRWAAFGFAGGDPEPGFWEAPGVLAYLRLCAQHPDNLGVALHEYSHVDTIVGLPGKIGKFRQLHAACDKHGIPRPVIQIKEFGWREASIPDRPTAMRELVEVAKMYMAHPNVHGAAIWTVRPWHSGHIQHQVRELIPHLGQAALEYAQSIPDEGPTVPAPVTTTPVALNPTIPTGYGYVTASYLNFRSEPSAEQGQVTVISVLPHGTKVEILSRLANGWLYVLAGNQKGYVHGHYISGSSVSPAALQKQLQTGMNINPDAANSNPVAGDELKGMNWVRFVFKVDDRPNAAERGSLDSAFAQYDSLIQAYHDKGVKTLLIINQETRHASPRDPGINWPAFCQKFARTAGQIAEHYKAYGDGVAYQIWNEADLDNSLYSIYLSPTEYAALLGPTAQAIRAASPQSPIILGGLATGPHAIVGYVNQCRAALAGALPVDAIGIHPYGRYVQHPPFAGWGFGTLADALDFYRANLPGLKFWITEIGIANDTALQATHYPAIAGYFTDIYKEVSTGYADMVPNVIWFAWSDHMHNAGIVKHNGEPKEHIFEAFRQVRDREIFS